MYWQTSRYCIDLSRPRVMGIVNVTPDSFSDGGVHASTNEAIAHCAKLVAEGADILDIGGESTRPGAPPMPIEVERERVLPVLREALGMGVAVSVDTYKPQLMREALDLGADIVNDIWAHRQPGALDVTAGHPRCGICLMHMHGEPGSMQRSPMEGDAVPQVVRFLREVTAGLLARGIARDRIAWDPGIGFGKTPQQNFSLTARQQDLLEDAFPLLVGWSRKSSLGNATGAPVNDRLAPSVAAALLAVERGAHLVRVHDVKETVAAFKVRQALLAAAGEKMEATA